MKLLKLSIIIFILLLNACASTGTRQTQVDRITPEELAKLMPAPVATLSLDEIINDSKQGKTPDEIIAKIKASNSRYALSSTQIVDLSKQGVDVKVLDYIQQSNELAKQNAIADEINKREKEKKIAQSQLQRERDFARDRYYDPFWGPGFGGYYGSPFLMPIGPAGRHWRGSRFGWGLGYGYPYGW